jgi:hypothetical protein
MSGILERGCRVQSSKCASGCPSLPLDMTFIPNKFQRIPMSA